MLMKKTLRLSLVALMAMLTGNVNAQEVTIDLTTNDGWNFPTENTKTAASYTKDGVTLTFSESNNGHRFVEKDAYLIFGKQDAAITFSAFSFDVERIDIVGREGASTSTRQNIYVGSEAVSTETVGATATCYYKIAEGKQAAGTIYTLKVNSNHNSQITKIMIWKKGTSTTPDTPDTPEVSVIGVTKALEAIAALADGATTSEKYQVKGFIVGAPDFQRKDDGSLYGNVNCKIADEKGGTQLLTVFRGKNFGNQPFTEETISTLKEGDEVVFEGQLQKYIEKDGSATPEIKNCYLISVNGKDAASVKAVRTDLDANAPAYNVSGQKVSDNYRGLVIQNGRKYINK